MWQFFYIHLPLVFFLHVHNSWRWFCEWVGRVIFLCLFHLFNRSCLKYTFWFILFSSSTFSVYVFFLHRIIIPTCLYIFSLKLLSFYFCSNMFISIIPFLKMKIIFVQIHYYLNRFMNKIRETVCVYVERLEAKKKKRDILWHLFKHDS